MWTLGLETSTRSGSVAIWDGEHPPIEKSLGANSQKHATTLFQTLDELLKEQNLTPRDLGRIAVSIGPGSFTGLRIGVVAAKTLAYTLNCEIKAIDTFLAVAHQAPEEITGLSVIGDAQRGDLFVGDYGRDEQSKWQMIDTIRIVSAVDFQNSLTDSQVIAGPGLTRYSTQLKNSTRLSEDSLNLPHASAVCELAGRSDLPSVDHWSLQPLYLRKSSAEEKWEQKQNNKG